MYTPAPLSFPALRGGGLSSAPIGGNGRNRFGERLLGKHVLIVEDEALLALELELAFGDEGAEIVGPALSLSHGVMLVEATAQIDCAVLDVDLGGRDVFPIAHALEQRGIPGQTGLVVDFGFRPLPNRDALLFEHVGENELLRAKREAKGDRKDRIVAELTGACSAYTGAGKDMAAR